MLSSLARFRLRSRIKKDNTGRKKQFMPWEKIEKIALVLHGHDGLNKSAIDRFIDDTKKFVEVFYIDLKSKTPAYADWRCFSKKDASVLSLPRPVVFDELKNKKFDLVIATPGHNAQFAAALVSGMQAPFKCGFTGDFNEVDLIIERPRPGQLSSYLEDVMKYLKMIKV